MLRNPSSTLNFNISDFLVSLPKKRGFCDGNHCDGHLTVTQVRHIVTNISRSSQMVPNLEIFWMYSMHSLNNNLKCSIPYCSLKNLLTLLPLERFEDPNIHSLLSSQTNSSLESTLRNKDLAI